MPSSTAQVATPNARKYMTQLCKHWSHKLVVSYDEQQGRIEFDDSRACNLRAADSGLTMEVETATAEELDRTQTTLVNHLKRFAFREDFGDIAWVRSS